MLEYTDISVRAQFAPQGIYDFTALMALHAVVMPEIGQDEPGFARLGRIVGLTKQNGGYRYQFIPDTAVEPIPLQMMLNNSNLWGMDEFEFYRTHWAVKNLDVYEALWGTMRDSSMPRPKVFNFPTDRLQSDNLVAVMMPFSTDFDPVYETLREASNEAGLHCQRADDIWKNDHILDDVLELIWTARVVIADLTGKNANVFYETGIAHTIGRDVILTTQNIEHVPFDLRAIRTLTYYPNTEGLTSLKDRLRGRLKTIIGT